MKNMKNDKECGKDGKKYKRCGCVLYAQGSI